MTKNKTTAISLGQFKTMVRDPSLQTIDGDNRFYNLSKGFWVYDELLSSLRARGWVRVAPGFKSGIYAHRRHEFCIKILGMGVGENPQYFCERGYYLAHERAMLQDFRAKGFDFAPEPLSRERSVRFLIDECGIQGEQAEKRVYNDDVLIMEFISGVPFATQTGCFVNYDINILPFDNEVLDAMLAAMQRLRSQLQQANTQHLVHNDPMPPNIILTVGTNDQVRARLVDFELAQNLRNTSPDYVNKSVAELYLERDVPRNLNTHKHKKNLDQHLMDQSVGVAEEIVRAAPQVRELTKLLDGVEISIPFIGGIGINLGRVYKYLKNG